MPALDGEDRGGDKLLEASLFSAKGSLAPSSTTLLVSCSSVRRKDAASRSKKASPRCPCFMTQTTCNNTNTVGPGAQVDKTKLIL